MRSNQDMLTVLKGSVDDQKILFNEFISRMASGEILEEGELIVMEALKKQLFKPKSIIVSMESNLKGVGGATI